MSTEKSTESPENHDLEQPVEYGRLLDIAEGRAEVDPAAFAELPRVVACMDERARVGEPVIGFAGSGVLVTADQRQRFVAKVKAMGIDPARLQITYHEECGAASIFCETNPGLTPAEAAERAADSLKSAAGFEAPVAKIGWSDDARYRALGRPDRHHARVVYIDFTGRFDPEAVGLPDGFLISAAYSPDHEYLRREVTLAQDIAAGRHGRGADYFRKNGPLLLTIVSVDPDTDLKSLGDSLEHRSDITRTIFIEPGIK